VIAGELDLAPLAAPVPFRRLSTPSTFPPVEFDLAFVVPTETTAASLLEATTAAGGELVEHAAVFDEYEGGSLGEARKSLAIRFLLRAGDRTLTNEEAGEVRRAMVAAAESTGAELRGAG
jgi:phenylalanyl-tRNA synthetase beta chain